MNKKSQTLIILSLIGLAVVIWLFASRKGQTIVEKVEGAALPPLPGSPSFVFNSGDNRLNYTPASMSGSGEGWALPAFQRPNFMPDYTVLTLPAANSPSNNDNPVANCDSCKSVDDANISFSGITPPNALSYLPYAWGR